MSRNSQPSFSVGHIESAIVLHSICFYKFFFFLKVGEQEY